MSFLPYVAPYRQPAETLLSSINRKQLLPNLKLCLDVADAVSYPGGTGQTWVDRSGLGNDFFRGTTNAAQANDPTFNGTAGSLSKNTYWGFDGGDVFTINNGAAGYSTALNGWISNIHRAKAKFTLFCWWYPSESSLYVLMGTSGREAAEDRGFLWQTGGATMSFSLKHGLTGISPAGPNITLNEWNCAALSIDEGLKTGNATFFQNGSFSVLNCSYASPDTGTASNILQIGAKGATQTSDIRPLPNGSRMSQMAVWEGAALTQAQIAALYDTTKARFK